MSKSRSTIDTCTCSASGPDCGMETWRVNPGELSASGRGTVTPNKFFLKASSRSWWESVTDKTDAYPGCPRGGSKNRNHEHSKLRTAGLHAVRSWRSRRTSFAEPPNTAYAAHPHAPRRLGHRATSIGRMRTADGWHACTPRCHDALSSRSDTPCCDCCRACCNCTGPSPCWCS